MEQLAELEADIVLGITAVVHVGALKDIKVFFCPYGHAVVGSFDYKFFCHNFNLILHLT